MAAQRSKARTRPAHAGSKCALNFRARSSSMSLNADKKSLVFGARGVSMNRRGGV
jgi:hypothetical protein